MRRLIDSGWPACVLLGLLAGPASAGMTELLGIEEDTGRLYAISTGDASLRLIGETGLTAIGALEFSPHDGALYAFTTTTKDSPAALYQLNLEPGLTGVTVDRIGDLGLPADFEGGLAFAPDGTAYGVNAGTVAPSLFTLNLTTGAATVVSPLDQLRHDFSGLGWRNDGVLLALDGADQALYSIDPLDFTLTLAADVEAEIGGVAGMALLDGTGFFVTAGPGSIRPGSNELYAFDPFTGEQTLIGSFEDFITGSGFAGLSVVPEPASLVLLSLAGAILLRHRHARRRTRPAPTGRPAANAAR